MKISLIGFMGSGKSTVGQCLAQFFQLRYYEMDQMIVGTSGRDSIPQIFELDGEVRFRELEIATSKQLSSIISGVISTGGGVVQNKIILDYLRANGGHIVYLEAPFDELAMRVTGDSSTVRPLFTDTAQARRLYHLRAPLYQAYSDLTIHTHDQKPEDIAREIAQALIKK